MDFFAIDQLRDRLNAAHSVVTTEHRGGLRARAVIDNDKRSATLTLTAPLSDAGPSRIDTLGRLTTAARNALTILLGSEDTEPAVASSRWSGLTVGKLRELVAALPRELDDAPVYVEMDDGVLPCCTVQVGSGRGIYTIKGEAYEHEHAVYIRHVPTDARSTKP